MVPNKIRHKLIKLKNNRDIIKEVKEAKLNVYNQVINQISSK